ncbi:hypothetical protein PoB_006722600 [Plakobranchus ocellatus]|uniref:Uncharacterized protein n=1 Tax=Plakobranchus ocellatus TaxID=259542 RepID=A0AAV4D983_9GAST|nr:hypothetical protein PoB_006722600 [Plakobranchus ocellatus]
MLYRGNRVASLFSQLCNLNIDIRQLSCHDLKLIFRTVNITRELFPDGRVYNFNIPYRVMEANIRHFFGDRFGVLASFTQPDGSNSKTVSKKNFAQFYWSARKGKYSIPDGFGDQLDLESLQRIEILTLYTCYASRSKGFVAFLDLHARQREISSEHIRAHLLRGFKMIHSFFPFQDGALTVTFDIPLNRNLVLSCLKQVGVEEIMPNQEKYLIVLEKPLRETISFISSL